MTASTQIQLADAIVKAVGQVVGDAPRLVPLHAPEFSDQALANVTECVTTGWVSSAGAFVTRFEQDTAAYTGAAHAVATVNGTAALHIALLLAGVGPDDEVIIPSLTFIATAAAVSYLNATPHFADIDPATLGLDPARLAQHLDNIGEQRDGACYNKQTGRRIAAIVPMHTFGHPADLDGLVDLAQRHNTPLVEDAAESLGSTFNGKHTGTFGRLGILSYNGNKIMTTGGGGMILTDDPDLAAQAKHITTTAKLPHPYEYIHDRVGYNYRMPNLNAALGVAELARLDTLIDAKRRLHARYVRALEAVDGATMFTGPHHAECNCWLNAIVLDRADAELRDAVLVALNNAKLQSRPVWQPMHRLDTFTDCPRADLSVTEEMAGRVINVPSSAQLVEL